MGTESHLGAIFNNFGCYYKIKILMNLIEISTCKKHLDVLCIFKKFKGVI